MLVTELPMVTLARPLQLSNILNVDNQQLAFKTVEKCF